MTDKFRNEMARTVEGYEVPRYVRVFGFCFDQCNLWHGLLFGQMVAWPTIAVIALLSWIGERLFGG